MLADLLDTRGMVAAAGARDRAHPKADAGAQCKERVDDKRQRHDNENSQEPRNEKATCELG